MEEAQLHSYPGQISILMLLEYHHATVQYFAESMLTSQKSMHLQFREIEQINNTSISTLAINIEMQFFIHLKHHISFIIATFMLLFYDGAFDVVVVTLVFALVQMQRSSSCFSTGKKILLSSLFPIIIFFLPLACDLVATTQKLLNRFLCKFDDILTQ